MAIRPEPAPTPSRTTSLIGSPRPTSVRRPRPTRGLVTASGSHQRGAAERGTRPSSSSIAPSVSRRSRRNATVRGSVLRTYAYSASLISQSGPTGAIYDHHDGLGSITDLTSSAGASIAWTRLSALRGRPKRGVSRPGLRQAHSLSQGSTSTPPVAFTICGPGSTTRLSGGSCLLIHSQGVSPIQG